MMNAELTKDKILSKAQKFLDDKKFIAAYARGEVTLKELNDRGITLAMPI